MQPCLNITVLTPQTVTIHVLFPRNTSYRHPVGSSHNSDLLSIEWNKSSREWWIQGVGAKRVMGDPGDGGVGVVVRGVSRYHSIDRLLMLLTINQFLVYNGGL